MPPEPFLVLDQLHKRFGDLTVIRDLSLTVSEGEVLALLGPSGSGKTTLLRLLAGFETPDRGSIRVAGSEVVHLPPARRRFGMVFQHYALFPHLSVGENVAFGLTAERGRDRAAERLREAAGSTAPRSAAERQTERVAAMLRLVGLDGFEGRRVGEISGGQQQRVALARALAPAPRLLLLDEPLSNLDPGLRERTRRALKRTVREVGITTVLVTHEQEEAFDISERVAVLHDGIVDQVGTPEELYASPSTRFVAGFVGRASVLSGTFVDAGAGGPGVRLAGDRGPLWPGAVVPAPDGRRPEPERAAELVARPEHLSLADSGTPGAVAGRIVDRRFNGVLTYVTVRLALPGEPEVEVLLDGKSTAREGDDVAVAPSRGATPRIFPGTEAADPSLRTGSRATLLPRPRASARRADRSDPDRET